MNHNNRFACMLLLLIASLTGCVIEATDNFIRESANEMQGLAGRYLDSNHDVYQIYQLGNNTFQYKGPRLTIFEAEMPADKRKEALQSIDEETKKERNNPNASKRAAALKSLGETRSKIVSNEAVVAQDDLSFSTSSLGDGWFVAQITNVFNEGFNLFDYTPQRLDIVIGRANRGSLLLYKTDKCSDAGNAKVSGISIEGKKITKMGNDDSLKKFFLLCINQQKIELGRELKRLN